MPARMTAAGAAAAGRWLVPALAVIVALLFVAALGVGPVRLAPAEIVAALTADAADPARIIVTEIRLPRAILSVAIGAMLGLAGAAMQGLLRNPLA